MGTVSSDPTDVIKQLDYIEVEKIDKDGNAQIMNTDFNHLGVLGEKRDKLGTKKCSWMSR